MQDTARQYEPVPGTTKRFRGWLWGIPFAISLLIIGISVLVSGYVQSVLLENARGAFEADSAVLAQSINNKIARDIYILSSVQGFFQHSTEVTRSEFQVYSEALLLRERYPGIIGLGYLQYVPDKQKDTFIASVRNDRSVNSQGYPSFTVFPQRTASEYLVLTYVYPEEINMGSMGFDFLSDAKRRETVRQAVVMGAARATGRIDLQPDIGPGFLIILPVFESGLPVGTPEEREHAVKGFVGVSIRGDSTFLAGVTDMLVPQKDIRLDIVDVSDADPMPLYSYNTAAVSGESIIGKETTIDVGGRKWLLRFSATGRFRLSRIEQTVPGLIIIVGLLIALLLFILIHSVVRSQIQARRVARQLSEYATESESKFQSITEVARDPIVMMDLSGTIVFWNKAAERIFGYTKTEILDRNIRTLLSQEENDREAGLRWISDLQSVSDTQHGGNTEVAFMTREGRRVVAEISSSSLTIQGKRHVVGIFRDITERKSYEDRLKEQTRELERMNKLMVGRELKMSELKRELDLLKQETARNR